MTSRSRHRLAPRGTVPHVVTRRHPQPQPVDVLPREQHAVAAAHEPAPRAQRHVILERHHGPGVGHGQPHGVLAGRGR